MSLDLELEPLLLYSPWAKRVSLDPIHTFLRCCRLCVLFFLLFVRSTPRFVLSKIPGLCPLKFAGRPRGSFFSREGRSVKGGGCSCADSRIFF